MTRYILSIDPSNKHSAYCLFDDQTFKPKHFGFLEEDAMLEFISSIYTNELIEKTDEVYLVIEGMQSFGMAVGASVLNTCVLIGRILERAKLCGFYKDMHILYRKEEKINLCGSTKAKDGNIAQALIDRFAPDTPNKGKGYKKEQGFFYGFNADVWQSYAVGITYYDMYYRNYRKKKVVV